MSTYAHLTGTSVRSTVTATSQQLNLPMVAKGRYAFSTTTACYILQGASPTALSDGSGPSSIVPAGATIYLDGGLGAKLAVKRDSADGVCTLSQVVAF